MGSALFANQREINVASTIALVEEVLGELGHDAAQSHTEGGGASHAWQVRTGSALTRVSLVSRTEFTHLRVCSTVMTINAQVDRAALHSHLLELNAGLCGAAFATDGDAVLLVAERSTLDLDRSEVRELIKRVTTYADEHDDVLVARFGGSLGAA
jgi:hypothetical protein